MTLIRPINTPDRYKAIMQDNGYIIPETLGETTNDSITKHTDLYAGQTEQHWSWETWQELYDRKIVTVVVCQIDNNERLSLMDALRAWWYQ